MRENYLRGFVILLLSIFSAPAFSQQDINDVGAANVTRQKQLGQLTGHERYTNRLVTPLPPNRPQTVQTISKVTGPNFPASTPSTACNCWIDRDSSWSVAQFDGSGGSGGPGLPPDYRNDDWSTDTITLPFNLCFYGQQVNKVFINNNGNVSIAAPYSTFTANSFPDPTYTMIAPFWADVDTRGPLSGLVYYKITSKYMIVQWENVGYYGTHDDLLNTFQLIITDGSDPIINLGQNVAFCYKDMQWTTGDASQGTGGFGGVPATVGVNQGNGIDYIQFGLFDTSGNSYDGPYGSNDGVDWLDGQSFTLNACVSSANIPPVLNSLNVCDTIHLCENSTYSLTANYLSPEAGQNTHINFFAFGMAGVSVVSNTPGPTATLELQIVGSQANVGFHTISITAIDDGTPAASTTNNFVIEVMPAPLPTFTFTPPQYINTTTLVNFNNTSPVVAGATYSWDFGDASPPMGTTNAVHTYGTPGTYSVILTATYPNGCITADTQMVVVCGPVSFTTTNQCVGDPATITLTSPTYPGANYTWDFDGGTVVSGSGSGPYTVTWSTAGNHDVTVIVADSLCAASDTQTVTINASPVASISPVSSLCVGDSPNINFTGTAGAGANYTWSFGSGTLLSGSGSGPYTVQFNNVGTDQITLLVDENGCSDSTTINVTVNAIPTSPFTIPPTACAFDPLTVTYTGNAGAGANYTWNFDNGSVTSGSGAGPYTVNWGTSGNYNVTLTVEENGCTSTVSSMPVAITATPVVSISNIAPLCEGSTTSVNFTGTSGAGATYTWNFGNANVLSGSGSGPYSLQWMSAGQDSVQLTVTENNCTSSNSISVTINAIPTSPFTVDNSACAGQPIGITYTGSAGAGANYSWSFGNANVISGSNQGPYSLSWDSAGSYQVSLTVTENNCTSTQTNMSATVNPNPVAVAGLDQASCSGVAVPIGDVNVPGNVYSWTPAANLSDPTISNPTSTIQNTTNNDDVVNYIVTVTDANGCSSSDSVLVTTHPVPVIGFPNLPGQCIDNNSFSFSATSNIANGMNYNWQFSGPANTSSSTQSTVNVSYSAVGIFPVMLNGDYNGCPAQPYSSNVEVYAMPAPDFSAANISGCRPLTVSFSNLTPGTGNFYDWNYGDGGTGNVPDPTYTYNTAGTYSVQLSARNSHGCAVDTTYANLIHVFPDAVANFLPSPPVANILAPIVTFNDYSVNAYTYQWDFGDSTPMSTDPSPSHTYSAVGTYNVTLMIASANGCVDTVYGMVTVEDNFSFYIPNTFTPNGDGVNDIFRGYGVAINSYSMNIYNRWGELIFKTTNYDNPWDGHVKNSPAMNDTYVYRIELVDLHGEKHTYVGDVSVVY